MTERKRRQKCCSVSLQSWMNQWKLLESKQSSTRFGKKSSNCWLWNMLHVWFFLKHCCNHRSKRIEAIQFHHIAAGVETEQVCNRLFAQFPASRGPFSFVFAELKGGTKRDLCHGSKLPLIQPPSMVVDGGFRNACSLYCLLTVTWAHCISRIPLQLFRCHLVSPHSNMPSWKEN